MQNGSWKCCRQELVELADGVGQEVAEGLGCVGGGWKACICVVGDEADAHMFWLVVECENDAGR